MEVTQDRRPPVHSPTLHHNGVNDERFISKGCNRPYHYHF